METLPFAFTQFLAYKLSGNAEDCLYHCTIPNKQPQHSCHLITIIQRVNKYMGGTLLSVNIRGNNITEDYVGHVFLRSKDIRIIHIGHIRYTELDVIF